MTSHEEKMCEYERRCATIINLDVDDIRKSFPKASSDYVLLSALHKMRYEMPEAPDNLRQQSRLWLVQAGQKRIHGLEFSEDGSLPQ